MQYPQNVLDAIVHLWEPTSPGGIPVPLPPNAQIFTVLEALFGASLMTEESQRFRLRVVMANAELLTTTGDVTITALAAPIPFSAGEAIKIAPALDATRSALAVWANAAGVLEIWAIVDLGLDAERLRLREANMAMDPPHCLFISSWEPGHLLAHQGSTHMVELKRGEFVPAAQHFMGDVVVGDFFNAAVQDLAGQREAMGAPAGPQLPEQARVLYRSVLSFMLYRIRELGRGGILIVLARPATEEPAAVLGRLVFKYGAHADHAWDTLLEPDLARADNWASVIDAAKFYGDLGGVDGALVMNDRLTVQGFGVKLNAPQAPELVDVVDRSNGDRRKPIAAFGTRHASSARFCWATPSALAYVVSEDGLIRTFRRVGGDIHHWPSVLLDQDLL